MQDQIDITKITDIKELKVMKADEYDKLEIAQRQTQGSQQNIHMLNARIAQLQEKESKSKVKSKE